MVRSDNTVAIDTVRWQIEEPNAEDRYIAPLRGASIETRVYLDGSMHVFDGETELRVTRVKEYCGDQKMLGIPGVRKRVIAKDESTQSRNGRS